MVLLGEGKPGNESDVTAAFYFVLFLIYFFALCYCLMK